MTLIKRERRTLHARIIKPAYEMLDEMAARQNRTKTSLIEVLIMDAYGKSGCSAGTQHPAGGDRHNAVSRGED